MVPSPHMRGRQGMSALRGCCTLCAVLTLVGTSLAVLVDIPQDSVNGTLGGSVLLPVSYRFDGAPRFPLSIRWMFCNSSHVLITCSMYSCSWGAGGAPSNCSAHCFPRQTYRSHAQLFPENGSLLLRDLQLSDSGLYSVTFGSSPQTWHVTLRVVERVSCPQHPGETAARIPCYVFGACYGFILLFLQLLFHLPWHRLKSREASGSVSRSVSDAESRQRRPQPGAAPPLG